MIKNLHFCHLHSATEIVQIVRSAVEKRFPCGFISTVYSESPETERRDFIFIFFRRSSVNPGTSKVINCSQL